MEKPSSSARRTRTSDKPAQRKVRPPAAASARWLLLIHQIPPKPDYLRVKIGRRLQQVGAVAIKNSVYVLPPGAESSEDFRWIVGEIKEGGGDAFISEASLGEGLTDERVRALFDAARNEEYNAILADARTLLGTASLGARSRGARQALARARQPLLERELARLRRRHESASAIDFFGASGQRAVTELLADLASRLRQRGTAAGARGARKPHDGSTWVTRRDVHVDRIASAWLIQRFIDRRPAFRFVEPTRHQHRQGELRFDMFEAEYTHVGDACTFETLVTALVPGGRALREIGEIVHDVDCKDRKFGREEAPGLARMIAGIVARFARDEEQVEHGAHLFDDLYAAYSGTSSR